MHAYLSNSEVWFLLIRLLLNIFVPPKILRLVTRTVAISSFLLISYNSLTCNAMMFLYFQYLSVSVLTLSYFFGILLFTIFQYSDDVMYEIIVDGL
jgi:hypothetical protein